MEKMKRRGLSDVVTTVLIILLVLAAVTIVWSFLKPAIINSVSQVSSTCLTVDVRALNCTYTGSGPYTVTVRYERAAGAGALTGTKLIITDGGNRDVSDGVALKELEGKQAVISNIAAVPTTFAAAGVITNDAGKSQVCQESAPVNCGA